MVTSIHFSKWLLLSASENKISRLLLGSSGHLIKHYERDYEDAEIPEGAAYTRFIFFFSPYAYEAEKIYIFVLDKGKKNTSFPNWSLELLKDGHSQQHCLDSDSPQKSKSFQVNATESFLLTFQYKSKIKTSTCGENYTFLISKSCLKIYYLFLRQIFGETSFISVWLH